LIKSIQRVVLVAAILLSVASSVGSASADIFPSQPVLSGRLLDGAGSPISGQTLALTGSNAVGQSVQVFALTASDGSYSFAPVPPGNYTFDLDGSNPPQGSAAPPRFIFSQSNTSPRSFLDLQTSRTLDLRLPVQQVTVHVQDATGAPLADAKVWTDSPTAPANLAVGLTIGGYTSYPQDQPATTAASGDATLWLNPTSYTVYVLPPTSAGLSPARQDNVQVTGPTYLLFAAPAMNEPPTANAGGPYPAIVNTPIRLTGSGSDAAGAVLTFGWDLDGSKSFATRGQSVLFTPTSVGRTTVVLRVCNDAGICTTSEALVSVLDDGTGGTRGGTPNPAATPELDSLLRFGSGLSALVGTLRRFRRSRR